VAGLEQRHLKVEVGGGVSANILTFNFSKRGEVRGIRLEIAYLSPSWEGVYRGSKRNLSHRWRWGDYGDLINGKSQGIKVIKRWSLEWPSGDSSVCWDPVGCEFLDWAYQVPLVGPSMGLGPVQNKSDWMEPSEWNHNTIESHVSLSC
jgi:hypothetical protein